MRGRAFNGGAERQYSTGWMAVLFRNIGGAERAWDSRKDFVADESLQMVWERVYEGKPRSRSWACAA